MLGKLNQEEFKRSGLAVVKTEPGCSSEFVFASFVSESVKNGRIVVYVSANRSSESFRIASNKMSVRLDSQRFRFIELGDMMGHELNELTKSKLLEKIDNIRSAENVLVILDDIQLIADGKFEEEISLILDIQKRLNQEKSLIVFGTCREIAEYCFRVPLQFNVKPIGSGFGKKVNGQIDVVSYRSELDTLPTLSSFHYSIGERSIQMFYPGTASIL